MNIAEKKMTDILADLKENYGALSVKTEFETEGADFQEAVRLKEIADKSGLKFTVKIGGCEAIKDLYDTKLLCADEIVAPMIESPYALKKYIRGINKVFSKEEKFGIRVYINIETVTGYNNLQDIMLTEEFSELSGIILGRDDMAGSMDLTTKEVDSDIMINMAYKMSEKMHAENKEFVIGGSISPKTPAFFSKIPYLSRYETRKIIYDAKQGLNIENIDGILKAIEFEMLWINNKRDNYGINLEADEQRLRILSNRCKYIEKTEF